MADINISELPVISTATNDDVFIINDGNATTSQITWGDLQNSIQQFTGQVVFEQGTAAEPVITFVGDLDLGIFSPGLDEIAFATNGIQRLTIDSVGSVGVGNNIPSSYNSVANTLTIGDLDTNNGLSIVSGSSSSGNIYFADGTDIDSEVVGQISYDHSDNHLHFGTSGTERLRIDSLGNVGIGTSGPQAKLDVNGDALFNTLTVGLGGGSVATNTAVGLNTLFNNTEGDNNTGVGRRALYSNTEGAYNTAVGRNSLFSNDTGSFNTGVGRNALNNNTIGAQNTAVGQNAGYYIEGSNNTILGAYQGTTADATLSDTVIISAGATERMRIDSSGDVGIGTTNPGAKLDVASGDSELLRLAIESGNISTPADLLLQGTGTNGSGSQQVILSAYQPAGGGGSDTALDINVRQDGDAFGSPNTVATFLGSGNVLIGGTLPASPNIELNADGSITAGTYNTLTVGLGGGSVSTNTAVGINALKANTTGTQNTAVGQNTLSKNTEGDENTAFGRRALYLNTTGGQNTAVGQNALNANTIGNYNTAVGLNTLFNSTEGNFNTGVGVTALTANTTGSDNTAVGRKALFNNTEGDNNTSVGSSSLNNNTTGTQNTAVGQNAGFYIEGSNNTILGAYLGTTADATLSDTVIISAGTTERMRIDSSGNVGIGGTLPASPNIELNEDGSIVTAADATINTLTVGLGGGSVTTNTAVGVTALNTNTTGIENTAVGRRALYSNTEGSYNTALGQDAHYNNTTGSGNTAFGRRSLFNNTIGGQNTAVGRSALLNNTEGNNNTGVGSSSLINNTTGLGNIAIGGVNSAGTYAPVFDTTTESNRIVMGSTSVTNAYVQVAWTVTSDARDKTNFASVPYGLDFVNQLKPTAYQFKLDRDTEETNGGVRYGFKAQEILALEGDNPVIIDNEDPDHLKYKGEHLVPVLVNAVQELTAMVNDLKAEVQALKEAAS